jgi:hydroxymethylbilane synthase
MRLRIATRRSPLAVSQTQLVAEMIRRQRPGVEVELVTMTTRGDTHAGPLAPVGGKGLFTRELEESLRAAQVQLAVHSAKDLPAGLAEEFVLAAVPERADPRDALVSRWGSLAALRPGAVVGTGSPRRRAQLLALRGDLVVQAVRGNVQTRLLKALGPDASADAVVLAMAGLGRSGLAAEHQPFLHPLEVADFVPAAGQGILAIETLAADRSTRELLACLDHPASRQALEAERGVLRVLGAGCQSCVAIHVCPAAGEGAGGGGWAGLAMVARLDGTDMIRVRCVAPSAAAAGEELAAGLLARGAAGLLAGQGAGEDGFGA